MFKLLSGVPREPENFLASLRKTAEECVAPPVSVLGTYAEVLAKDIDRFYPPQIFETLQLFAQLGFSDQRLFTAFTGRMDDVFARCSPKRLVDIAGLFARLRLPLGHPEIFPIFRQRLIEQLPGLRRGVVALSAALRNQGLLDETLATGLFTQAEILHRQQILSDAQFWQVAEELLRSPSIEQLIEIDRLAIDSADDGRTVLMKHLVSLKLKQSTGASFDEFTAKLNTMETAEFVKVATDATKVGLFSPRLAEQCFARLENTPTEHGNFLRLLFAGVKLGFSESAGRMEIFDLLLNKAENATAGLLPKQQLVVARLAALARSPEADDLARRVSPWLLSLEERRLLWDVAEIPSVLPRLPLVPKSLAGSELNATTIGPHVLVDGALHGTRLHSVGSELAASSPPQLRPDAWLIKAALEGRYGLKDVRLVEL